MEDLQRAKIIKMHERNLERLRTSPNWPGAGTPNGENWRQILIWDIENSLEDLKHDSNSDAGTGDVVHDEHAEAKHSLHEG